MGVATWPVAVPLPATSASMLAAKTSAVTSKSMLSRPLSSSAAWVASLMRMPFAGSLSWSRLSRSVARLKAGRLTRLFVRSSAEPKICTGVMVSRAGIPGSGTAPMKKVTCSPAM